MSGRARACGPLGRLHAADYSPLGFFDKGSNIARVRAIPKCGCDPIVEVGVSYGDGIHRAVLQALAMRCLYSV